MAETDHTPKMFPKFIQGFAFGDTLVALDDNGDFWHLDPRKEPKQWVLVIKDRKNE